VLKLREGDVEKMMRKAVDTNCFMLLCDRNIRILKSLLKILDRMKLIYWVQIQLMDSFTSYCGQSFYVIYIKLEGWHWL